MFTRGASAEAQGAPSVWSLRWDNILLLVYKEIQVWVGCSTYVAPTASILHPVVRNACEIFFKCLQVTCTLHQRRPIWTCPYNQGGPDSGCCTLPHRGYACQYSSDRYLWLLLVSLLFVQLWRNQNVFTYGLHCHPVSGVAYHSGDSPATATGILAAVHTSFIKLEWNVLYTLWFSHCWHMPTGQEYFKMLATG